jgi:hypothetical protein
MIDPLNENVISLSAAARLLPRLRNNKPVNPSTVWRWSVHGVKGKRLETVKVGGVTATSVEAVRRFLRAINGQPELERAGGRRQDAVEQELSTRGI